ncbi:MAG: galactose oxidase-like domain-containing protein [Chloroflexota bacterium]
MTCCTGKILVAGGKKEEANAPDPVTAPVGYYLLFAMVDDIPSAGRTVVIDYPYRVDLPTVVG